jgi:uncharacterized membrane protein
VKTTRIEALADGVFAIVMTLLVLDLKVPDIPPALVGAELGPRLLALWPHVLSYAVTFVILGTLYIGHHNQFHYIRRADRPFLWINIVFLLCVALLPFSAALFSRYGDDRIAAIVYGSNLVAAGAALYAHWGHATRGRRLVDPSLDAATIRVVKERILLGIGIYTVASAASFVSPVLSIALFVVMPVFYVLPGRVDRSWQTSDEDEPLRPA